MPRTGCVKSKTTSTRRAGFEAECGNVSTSPLTLPVEVVLFFTHPVRASLEYPIQQLDVIGSLGIGKCGNENKTTDFPVSANELNKHYLSVSTIDDAELASLTETFYDSQSNLVSLCILSM